MAKDAKGHGSDARGGGSYHNINNNLRGPGKHVGYAAAGDVYHIQKSNGPKSNWYSAVQQNGNDVFSGKGLGAISQKLQERSDAFHERAIGGASAVAAQHGIPTSHLTPLQSENVPFKSRLSPAAGHSYLDPKDPRGKK
jgi:hypothetical protein